ncbi:MAG: EAL domain-containing protein [Gallionellaceae bacterium]|nr:EAL domain-containing protein [Gallionellaceae bacterium]
MLGNIEDLGPKHQSISILIVEDELRYLESTRLLLDRHVDEIIAAETGHQALGILESRRFDIVLLDLGLPDMSGHEVMARIRQHWPETIVIVVSGDASIESAVKALRLGAYDYLRKPYESEELIKIVRNSTQKLNLHNENRHFQQRLQHSEYLHRLLVNSSPDIIYTLDPEGRFTFLNESAQRILGVGAERLIGRHYDEIVYRPDREQARYSMNDRRTGERATQNFELRFKLWPEHTDCRAQNDAVTVELNAMGLYRTASDGQREFIGSYGVARDISERKRAEATIAFQAYHDLLTGLPNRALFRDRLGQTIVQAKRLGQKLAILFLDLDHFKMVNDTLGHLVGDELLQAVSLRLRGCLRETDTLARIGGDEFLVLLPHIRSNHNTAVLAQKIITSLKAPFHIEEHELFVSLSVGAALYPDDGETIETLIKHADMAMYHAKDRGRNGYCLYTRELDNSITGRLDIQTGLRRALQRGEFEVHYQPQVDIASGQIVGMEALVRWRHPEKGMIQPADFIAIAEDSGLIGPISDWVLQVVCQQAHIWQQMALPPITLAVNLSARQIEHPDFVANFSEILKAYHLDGSRVEIEITESTLMRDIEGCIVKLKQLSDLGVEVSIDDFGTGYSSLSYLQKLPIHTLKIDKSFVNSLTPDLGGASIVNGIAAMAKGMHLNLIAEGVESAEQLAFLKAVGCDAYQGFLFSKPVDSAQATRLLETQPH